MKAQALFVFCLGIFTSLHAATLAIIDSGVDYTHPQLQNNMWRSKSLDFGWNFADNNSNTFDPLLIQTFSPEVKKFSAISSKSTLFSATEEEKEWAKEKASDKAFMAEVDRFSSYIHGTHVGGIAMKGTDHKIMAIKLLSTPVKAMMKSEQVSLEKNRKTLTEKPLDMLLITLALKQSDKFKNIGTYLHRNRADVANGSFGFGIYQAAEISKHAFKLIHRRDPSNDELVLTALKLMKFIITTNKVFVDSAPDTLFVFAAGNDGLSNDKIGASPANIKADNTITVAATYKDLFLASFSNYGKKMVEIAAPGMLIDSSIPGSDYLAVSGTSQAAPFVANVAGLVKDANKSLKPVEIKKILMETVDKKAFLLDRVASGGIVNSERAVMAANLSHQVSLDEAIERAALLMPQKKVNKIKAQIPHWLKDIRPIALPSPFEM